ncbi:MAG: AAA family ATPase [Rhodobacteraceae bacterium]|nr:AAA family ATPase [Paracoccaceae bacterium]
MKQQAEGNLELEVTNFGPIIKAKIDLRPLTVFIGPSNTGKSYLAILVYALHKVFGNNLRSGEWRFMIGRRFSKRHHLVRMSQSERKTLREVADSIMSDFETDNHRKLDLSPQSASIFCTELGRLKGILSGEIARCFGVGAADELTRKGQNEAPCIVMRQPGFNHGDLAQHTLSLKKTPEFEPTVPQQVQLPEDFRAYHNLRHWQLRYDEGAASKNFVFSGLKSAINEMLVPGLFKPLHVPAYYLPADRTGVMHAHNVVVSALIANAPNAGLRPSVQTPMLSGVLADFLEQLIDMSRAAAFKDRRHPNIKKVSKLIEDLVLEGRVQIDQETDLNYPHFSYRPKGWKRNLALANASSMVSELAPVVMYLQYMIETGNLLIVEEPESHLHPEMQVKFMRQIARLVSEGVRVVITTHSEWLLEELANIVRRSEMPAAKRKKDEIALGPDQVGAWLFKKKQRPKGSVINEIPLDESGLYPSGYGEVARELHNDWANISNEIENGS